MKYLALIAIALLVISCSKKINKPKQSANNQKVQLWV